MELTGLPAGDDLSAIAAAVCAAAGIGAATAEVLELATLPGVASGPACSCRRPLQARGPVLGRVDDRTHLAGPMDLVYRDSDELVVVDFKTNDVVSAHELDAAAVKHSGQAAARDRDGAGAGLAVREVVLVFARAGVERVLARPDLPTALSGRRSVGERAV